MFKVGDRVRLVAKHERNGEEGTVTGFSTTCGELFVRTTISIGGWYPSSLELIETTSADEAARNDTVSLRCEYCDDHSHLTVECPGLRHGNPIAEAFKAERFPRPAPLMCSACGQPSHPGRKMFCPGDVLLCGDCVAGGTPLIPQPVVEPLTAADCNSWSTACEEGVG